MATLTKPKPTAKGRGYRTHTALSFENQIRRFKTRVGSNVELFMQLFGHEMAEELMYNTPYITGWLRGSWLAGFHSNLRRGGTHDPTGSATLAEMQMRIADYKLGQKIYFMNTAEYSWWVERGTHKMVGRYYMRRAVFNGPSIAVSVINRIQDRL